MTNDTNTDETIENTDEIIEMYRELVYLYQDEVNAWWQTEGRTQEDLEEYFTPQKEARKKELCRILGIHNFLSW